jgi:hypothetical protein
VQNQRKEAAVAVVSIMELKGDPDELIGQMEPTRELAERKAREYGGIASIVARTDDGAMIINLWETEEGRHQMADDPEMRAQMEKTGFRPNFKAYEVINYRTS